jgi:hypothetical protein
MMHVMPGTAPLLAVADKPCRGQSIWQTAVLCNSHHDGKTTCKEVQPQPLVPAKPSRPGCGGMTLGFLPLQSQEWGGCITVRVMSCGGWVLVAEVATKTRLVKSPSRPLTQAYGTTAFLELQILES